MKATEIAHNIYWVGANINTNDLFEGIWPIPNGITLNTYAVIGEKTALIDLVRDWNSAPTYLIDQLRSVHSGFKKIDYIILNHLEPDHTGWMETVKTIAENATIVTTAKGAELFASFYGDVKQLQIVKSGDVISLGRNKKLIFQEIPNVHWPETMATYEEESKVLFSCDAFGSFGALKGSLFAEQIPPVDYIFFEEEMLRYYANIIAAFSSSVLKAIESLNKFDVKIIAPSHGLVWRNDVRKIVERYKTYALYKNDYAEPEITVIWGSMYGNTEKALQAVLQGVALEKVPVHTFKVPETNASYVLAKAWQSAGLIIGMPTYEYKIFPPIRYIIDLLVQKHFCYKKVLRFGSYGWSGGAQKEFLEKTAQLKWDLKEPIEFAGKPKDDDLKNLEEAGRKFAQEISRIPSKIIK